MVVSPECGRGDDKEVVMATNRAKSREPGADRIIDSVADAERSALDAVRRFLDTVNKSFPDVGPDGGQRQRIIDSAFRMTEELVGTTNQFAHRLVEASADAAKRVPVSGPGSRRAARHSAKKAPAEKATAEKATARKAPAKKATARKAPARKAAAR
jgi:hypothetical protein